ncbi:MAG: hypothetical protein ACRD0O_21550 [Acidimicrobiia bacterium]
MEESYRRLAAMAGGQHALVTNSQLDKLGIERHERQRLLAGGQLIRPAPRVLQISGSPLTWQGRTLAEALSTGDDAIVSHRSAAALYDLDGFDPLRIVHLTLPRGRWPARRKDVRYHLSLDYDLIRRVRRQGIEVTDAARLVLDLYGWEPNLEVARRGLFSARKKQLVTWTELSDCLETHARRGRRGITRLRADLDLYSRIGCPETTFEDAIRQLLMDAGLPEPELQHRVTANGHRYRIDVAYPEFKVGVEGKSKAHHLTEEAFESDSVRDADLAIAGWIIIHVTWARLRDDPEGVVRRIRRALSRRAGVAA